MDYRVLGLDGFVGSETTTPTTTASTSTGDATRDAKIVGSGLDKEERPCGSVQEEWRNSKIPRNDDFSVPKTIPLHHNTSTSLLRSNSMLDSRQQEHMLTFSSLKPEVTSFLSKDCILLEKTSQNSSNFSYYHHNPSACTRSAGYGSGNMNASLHGPFTGVRGPFTPSQWMELEHQALIYKYLTANVPVPSNLLIPLKKSLYPYAISGSSAGSFPSNALGWGTFHLGYPGNTTDPEPGRCRRTDGKKWRCSRDAVADQKYCERHINRGRHRSRKPVEGQTGHAATGTTNSKVAPMTSSVSTSVITSGAASNSLAIAQQFKNVQPGAANSFTIVNRGQDPRGLTIMSSTVNLKTEESAFGIPKQNIPIEESSHLEFGLVSFDSLLNPSQRTTYLSSKNYESFLNFSDQESQDQNPLRQYTDDWPKDQSNRAVISWPEELKSDWTQLSMSIPVAASEFFSSTSSPTQEKAALSPLRLSREFDPSYMDLGVNNNTSESSHKQANWIPISWGTSMGGPLGEVLTTTAGNAGSCKNSSSLSLLTEGWDGSPQLGSSPTGVLQKATFGSLSNSSSGSSPRGAEIKKNNDGVTLHDDVLGSTIVSSKSNPIPSL